MQMISSGLSELIIWARERVVRRPEPFRSMASASSGVTSSPSTCQAARLYDAPGGVDAAPRCRDGTVTSTS